MMHTFRHALLVTLGLTAANVAVAQRQQPSNTDSLVLERTLCFGTCPAYRLRLSRDGQVLFQSRNPADSTVARDSIGARVLPDLIRLARAAGFFALPTRIRDDRRICVDLATDHPTVTITIFGRDSTHVVEDYHGCSQAVDHSFNPTLRALRRFEVAVDSALGSARWVRPARGVRGRLTAVAVEAELQYARRHSLRPCPARSLMGSAAAERYALAGA